MSRNSSGASSSSSSPPAAAARRTPHDDLADDDEGFVMGMGERDMGEVVYRRAEVAQHISEGAMAPSSHSMASMMPKDNPLLAWESSGETVPSWAGATDAASMKQRHVVTHRSGDNIVFGNTYRRASPVESSYLSGQPLMTDEPVGKRMAPPAGPGNQSVRSTRGPPISDEDDDDVPETSAASFGGFWSPFGADAVYAEELPEGTPRVCHLPSAFRLERTNFTAKPEGSDRPSIEVFLEAVSDALEGAEIDVLCLRNEDCTFECSYHRGNRFISLWMRVYLPPDDLSPQPFGDDVAARESSYLVEAQLREGDRLHFSALFRDVMKTFRSEENGMSIGGTYRYQQRPRPARGEVLVLEEASFAPSRQSLRLMAEQQQAIASSTHPVSMRRALAENIAGGGDAARRDVLGSAPPLPSGIVDGPVEALDADTSQDVFLLASMLSGQYLDVQTDAATAVAGLTADDHLLQSLSQLEAAAAASALCTAAARLLVETPHRPARRQAAVIVANLATTPGLCAHLLASDHAPSSSFGKLRGPPAARGILQGLVELVVGENVSWDLENRNVEEEIGTRRECMRALVSLAQCDAVLYNRAVQSMLECKLTGRGGNDAVLQSRLRSLKNVFEAKFSK